MRREQLVNTERYHVFNRGAFRSNIFLDDEDRGVFLYGLQKYQYTRSGLAIVAVSAFVLMQNHFHLAIQQLCDGGISRYIQRVCIAYAMYFNEKYKKPGCLFSGRFQARHIDDDAYFLHLTRYIHQNPLKVLGDGKLEDYEWSSYRTYLGMQHSPIVTDRLALEMFESGEEYAAFMRSWRPAEEAIVRPYTFKED